MNAAKIWLGSYAFHVQGEPQYGWRTEYLAENDAVPSSQRTTYTIEQQFFEDGFKDNEARIAILRQALDAGEALLIIEDEGGVELVREVVTLKDSDCPREWRQYTSKVTVTLQGTSRPTLAVTAASYTPAGGTAIALPNVTSWRENVETERLSDERSHRAQTMVNIAASGFILADKSLPLAERREWLLARQAELRGVHSREGVLTFAGQTFTVRVRSLEGDPGDGSDRLEWSLQAFYRMFPDGDYAEAKFTVTTREDPASGEIVTSVRGDVRAAARATAMVKIAAIRAVYQTSGQSLRGSEISDDRADGADGQTWISVSFSFEFRMAASSLTWEMRINTRADVRTADNTITYEGSVRGKTASEALTKARSLGLGHHPMLLSSGEQVSTRRLESEPEQFLEVTFTYEYVVKNAWLYAEISSQKRLDPFGDSRLVISGFAAAGTEAQARILALTFQNPGLLAREKEETVSRRQSSAAGTPNHFVRLDFSAAFYLTPTASSASYTREEASNFESLEKTITFSGTAYGPTESACHSFIDTIVEVSTTGMKRRRRSRTPVFEKQVAGTQLLSMSFQEEYSGLLAAQSGQQILQASYAVRTVYSVNAAVITPIPFGAPHVQTACGITVATRTVRGSVLASTEAAALQWARGKRSIISGGYAEPPEEEVGFEFPPFETSTAKAIRVEFSYGAKYPNLTL